MIDKLTLRCNRKTTSEVGGGNVQTDLQFVSQGVDGKPLQQEISSASVSVTTIGKDAERSVDINDLRTFTIGEAEAAEAPAQESARPVTGNAGLSGL